MRLINRRRDLLDASEVGAQAVNQAILTLVHAVGCNVSGAQFVQCLAPCLFHIVDARVDRTGTTPHLACQDVRGCLTARSAFAHFSAPRLSRIADAIPGTSRDRIAIPTSAVTSSS